jgi:hypothetical protein
MKLLSGVFIQDEPRTLDFSHIGEPMLRGSVLTGTSMFTAVIGEKGQFKKNPEAYGICHDLHGISWLYNYFESSQLIKFSKRYPTEPRDISFSFYNSHRHPESEWMGSWKAEGLPGGTASCVISELSPQFIFADGLISLNLS